ncbi:MAG: NAD(+) synthase [Planctomycetota bacterium]
MSGRPPFSAALLDLDAEREVGRIGARLVELFARTLRRRGAVVAVSGGIDSSVAAALAVRAVGPERVLALLLPERDSAAETRTLGQLIVARLGVEAIEEDITPILDAVGCYRRRDEAIRAVIPAYGPGWQCKIVLPAVTGSEALRLFSVVVRSPAGEEVEARLPHHAYLGVVAASNFKQRVRKMLEYYHADRLHYAVLGTPNRLEYDQGFFVKLGDGAADVKPIAHLYKSQVYQLAAHLGVPEEIRRRPPTTDTYSMPQSQEEFYFSLPYREMDLCLYGRNHGYPPAEVAPAVGLAPAQVEQVYRDIDQKRSTTRYQHLAPLLIEPVGEIGG